jgi:hypothetical protein
MHKDISVAVPSRHRNNTLRRFIETYWDSINHLEHRHPLVTVLHDSPKLLTYDESVVNTDVESAEIPSLYRSVYIPDKSSLTELWNLSIIFAPTDWVLICNDDVTFNRGWLEYLEEQIVTDKYDMIHLFHYGGMCLHKRLILKMGWFDENFRGGGFEDIDYQLRISEAGLRDRVDRSHDYIRTENKVEIGHFMNHHRDVQSNGSWSGENNAEWMCEKWGRKSPYDYRIPSFRQKREVNWYPSYTSKYEKKYGIRWCEFEERIMRSMAGEPVYL